jgi:hypothetical protein
MVVLFHYWMACDLQEWYAAVKVVQIGDEAMKVGKYSSEYPL